MIRRARPGDCGEIKRLMDLCVRPTWSGDAVRAAVEREGNRFLVLEEGGRIAGYVVLETALDEGSLTSLAVAPEVRRRGYGSALVREAINGCGPEIRTVFLEVEATNEAARSLYEKAGFREISVRKRYYGDADAVIMSLSI